MAQNTQNSKHIKRSKLPKLFSYILLSFWGITTVYPFLWVIINSFRVKGEIRSDLFSIPWPWQPNFTLENYRVAAARADFIKAYTNSLTISLLVTAAVVVLAGLAAYALVRYEFRLKKYIYGLVIASMMFPVFSTIIPVFRMEVVLGIASTGKRLLSLLSVVLPQIAGNLSFSIIVLMGFIRSIPIEIEEAAYLDGCGPIGIYFRIILPVARPSFATVSIFAFLWSYNDLFTQMFFLRFPEERTITLLLNEISSQAGVNYGLMASSVVLVVLPVLLVYVILQKNIIKGLTVGAIKG